MMVHDKNIALTVTVTRSTLTITVKQEHREEKEQVRTYKSRTILTVTNLHRSSCVEQGEENIHSAEVGGRKNAKKKYQRDIFENVENVKLSIICKSVNYYWYGGKYQYQLSECFSFLVFLCSPRHTKSHLPVTVNTIPCRSQRRSPCHHKTGTKGRILAFTRPLKTKKPPLNCIFLLSFNVCWVFSELRILVLMLFHVFW